MNEILNGQMNFFLKKFVVAPNLNLAHLQRLGGWKRKTSAIFNGWFLGAWTEDERDCRVTEAQEDGQRERKHEKRNEVGRHL